MFGEPRTQLSGTADRQGGDPLEVVVELLQRSEFFEKRRRRLGSDPGDALDVVDGIARQGEIVGVAFGHDTEMRLDLVMAQAQVVGVVPVDVSLTHQLREVLVAGHERGRQSFGTQTGSQGADDVVGLVLATAEIGDTDVPTEFTAASELQLQVRRRRLAVRLVGGIDAVAEGGLEALVERDRDVARLRPFDQIAQEARETEQGMCRVALAIEHIGRHGVVRTEDIHGGVDEVDHHPIVAVGRPGRDRLSRRRCTAMRCRGCGSRLRHAPPHHRCR